VRKRVWCAACEAPVAVCGVWGMARHLRCQIYAALPSGEICPKAFKTGAQNEGMAGCPTNWSVVMLEGMARR